MRKVLISVVVLTLLVGCGPEPGYEDVVALRETPALGTIWPAVPMANATGVDGVISSAVRATRARKDTCVALMVCATSVAGMTVSAVRATRAGKTRTTTTSCPPYADVRSTDTTSVYSAAAEQKPPVVLEQIRG